MKHLTLRSKIFVFYAIAMISVLLLLAWFFERTFFQAIVDKANQSSTRELALIINNIETQIQSFEDYSRVIASDNQLQEVIKEINSKSTEFHEGSIEQMEIKSIISKITSNIINPNTRVEAVSVFGIKGIVYSGYSLDNKEVTHILEPGFIQTAIEAQKPTWSGPSEVAFTDGTRKMLFMVAKLIMDKETGEKLGVVILFFDEKNLSNIYSNLKQNKEDEFLIMNNEENVISAQNTKHIGSHMQKLLEMSARDFEHLKVKGSLINREDNLKILYSVKSFRNMEWSILSRIPLKEITTETNRMIKLIFIITSLGIIVFFMISYIIAFTISQPIHKLTGLMKQMVSGNIQLRANAYEKGEIGVLTKGFNQLMDRIEVLINDVYLEQELKRKGEWMLKQAQIKPHFLYNSIGTIISLINLEMKIEAIDMAKGLADFYKLSLSDGKDIITLKEEMDLTANYLKIQGFRYVDFITYDIIVEPGTLIYSIPKLTLQPIVENAIYHGLKEKNKVGSIKISTELYENYIRIKIYDNGCGMSEEQINNVLETDTMSSSFGMRSVDKRLKLYYGEEYGLLIKSEVGSYTEVSINIPKGV